MNGTASAPGTVDGAMIVKTGTLDLEVPHGNLRPSVNRVTGTAVGLGGYLSVSRTSYDVADATAQITIRVPVNNFDAAVKQLDTLPGVKVLGDSENGSDVTADFTNLQAQLNALTVERDDLVGVLAQANNIGDILNIHDRITGVQSNIDEIQGQMNLVANQASFSTLGVTLTERALPAPKKPKAAAAHVAAPPTGLEKSWIQARQGFANVVEWFIARSGGALILSLVGLILLFGLRYLYPVVRRALL